MRDIKEDSRRNFNSQAEHFDTGNEGKHSRKSYLAILNILSNIVYETILDLGCGTGAFIERVLNMDEAINAYGVDLSEKMLEQARTKLNGRATLIQGDSEHLLLESDFFDVVCCNDSFHHYPNPKIAIAEVKRILKPGGYFIICDPYPPFGALWIINFILRLTNTGNVKLYSKKELCMFLSDGFKDVTWKKVGGTAHMVCGIKK